MKKIERTDSTTIVFEYLFHVIKDEKEADNVLKDVTSERFFEFQRFVDEKTFAPWVAFGIPNNKRTTINELLKYCCPIEMLAKYPKLGYVKVPTAADKFFGMVKNEV
jgi:hypothetical protein